MKTSSCFASLAKAAPAVLLLAALTPCAHADNYSVGASTTTVHNPPPPPPPPPRPTAVAGVRG